LNARAVEVAGVMDDKLLSDAKSTLLNHMKTGAALSDTMERLFEIFEPFLGDQVDPEVVTPWRLENIVRTNTTEAYNHGRLAELVDPDVLPFVRGVRYQAIMDERTTDVCQFLDGKVFPPDSEALRSLLPPNHFQCRSVVTPIVTGMTVGEFITDAEIEEAKSLADSKFLAETGESRFDFNPSQPRHEAGSPEGGQWKDSEETVITDDVKVAARALADGKKVELLQEIEIATLMHELAEICIECIDKGEKAPTFDLCKVSVKGTNLFCTESQGIPRVQMPQLGGFPIPGSKADKLPRDPIYGGVDLTDPFKEHIRSMGVQIVEYRERVDLLRATQNELNGIKVSRIEKSMEAGKVPEVPIFVSRENYIIDGHHRWAADVGYSAIRGQLHNLTIPVIKIDLPIIHVLNEAHKFAKDWGMPQADVKKLSKECDQCQK
jgi:SPP1 gp7 family putative phage head morphogenesis protein